jgi:hypothetical protein
MQTHYWRYGNQMTHRKEHFPSNLLLEEQQETIKGADEALLAIPEAAIDGGDSRRRFPNRTGMMSTAATNFRWDEGHCEHRKMRRSSPHLPTVRGEARSSFAHAVLATDFKLASLSDAT